MLRAGIIGVLVCLPVWVQAAQPAAERSVYFYHDDHYRWCALADKKRFVARTDAYSDYGDESVSDTGEVTYRRGVATTVSETITNADYEVIDDMVYALDSTGGVRSVRMTVTEQDVSEKATHAFSYKVANGHYRPLTPQSAKAARTYHLRQAGALSGFPFASMLERARANPAGGPYCTGPMKD